MRDCKIIVPTSPSEEWTFDLDIINGCPAYVASDRNTQDQRAAISAYTVKGTIPGKPDIGIDWSKLLEQGATVLDIDNQIKQDISENAAIPSIATNSYVPIYRTDKNGIHVGIIQTQ